MDFEEGQEVYHRIGDEEVECFIVKFGNHNKVKIRTKKGDSFWTEKSRVRPKFKYSEYEKIYLKKDPLNAFGIVLVNDKGKILCGANFT